MLCQPPSSLLRLEIGIFDLEGRRSEKDHGVGATIRVHRVALEIGRELDLAGRRCLADGGFDSVTRDDEG